MDPLAVSVIQTNVLALGPTIYPQRPGQLECDFYMKTGVCKFGERCRFHHPIIRSAPTPSMTNQAQEQNVKLTPADLPWREGSVMCPYYLKTGTCKFGPACKFDHPPPGEVMGWHRLEELRCRMRTKAKLKPIHNTSSGISWNG